MADTGMTEELLKIDRSAIEELVRIREEQDVLKERLAKMESSRESVSSVVYERVNTDYRSRLDALEKSARPLKDVARREFAKLKALDEQYRKASNDVALEKEEIEFRQTLGEFTEEDFRSRIVEFDRRLAEHQSRGDAAAAMKAEFLNAFPSPADLELPSATPPPAAAPKPSGPSAVPAAAATPSPAPSSAPSNPGSGATAVHPAHLSVAPAPVPPPVPFPSKPAAVPSPAPAAVPAPAPSPAQAAAANVAAQNAVHEDATVLAAPMARPAPPMPPPPPSSPPSGGVSTRTTESGGSTVIFSMPKLVALTDGTPGSEEYVLSAKTSIGRTSKNDIQVLEDSVSRQHCEVILAPDGYKIMDLGSHNGLSVNGQKVTERLLADGDVIQVGTRQFMFRA